MSVDTTRFCGSCGAARESLALRFCRQCGAAFTPTGSHPAVPTPLIDARGPLLDARRRPRALVALLGLFGSATYAFFWLWMSWRELKRVRGDASMRPFWHALAMYAVPLYGLFRFHAHFRTIDELLQAAGAPVRAGAALLTLVFFLLLSILYGSLAVGMSSGGTASLGPLSLLVVGSGYAYIVATGQHALNAYYRSLTGIVVPERGHALEYVFIVLFALSLFAQVYVAAGLGR